MAQFRLLNNVTVGTQRLVAGTLIDDLQDNVAAIRSAGGRLELSTAALTAAATRATEIRARGGSEQDAEGVMLAAAAEQHEAVGAALADADQTITIDQGEWRRMPAATLTGNRVVTLGTGGSPQIGDTITVTRLGTEAFTLAVANGGGGGGTLTTLPVSQQGFATAQWNGTDWQLKAAGTVG